MVFKQKKALGQVFLKEVRYLESIIDVLKRHQVTHVLEIGPGGGVLTKLLLREKFKITAVEKDERFADFLPKDPLLDVVCQDILKFDLGTWLKETPGKKAVVGNIPYFISTPILMLTLNHLAEMEVCSLMVQKEYAERVAAQVGDDGYGSLSVYANLRAEIQLLEHVPKQAFEPVPKVDSAIISLHAKENGLSNLELRHIEKTTRMGFAQRRKKLRNGIGAMLSGKDESFSPIDLNRRPETLGLEDWIELSRWLSKT